MKVKIVKYETYPVKDPIAYAVGFDILLMNGRSFFIDTLINFEEIESGMSDEGVTNLAFEKIKTKVSEKIEELSYSKPMIIGEEFNVDSEYEDTAIALKGEVDKLISKVDENIKLGIETSEIQNEENLNLMMAIVELYELTLGE